MYKDDNFLSRERCGDSLLRAILDEKAAPAAAQSPEGNTEANWGLVGYPLASVYAPLQEYKELYDLDTALERGTLFSELDLEFRGRTLMGGGRTNA